MRAGHTQQQKSQHADQLARLGEYYDESLDLNALDLNPKIEKKIGSKVSVEREPDLLW